MPASAPQLTRVYVFLINLVALGVGDCGVPVSPPVVRSSFPARPEEGKG